MENYETRAKEMIMMRLKGKTYREIADKYAVSKQFAYETIEKYSTRLLKCPKRAKDKFNYDAIVYQGIYDFFAENEEEGIRNMEFAVFGRNSRATNEKIKNFLKGERNSFFTVSQIGRLCEFINKPFEEVFTLRKEVSIDE